MFVSSSTGQYRFHVINIYILIYIFKKKSGSIPNYTRTTFTVVFFFPRPRVQVFEIRNADDLSEEWLKEKLSFFRWTMTPLVKFSAP